MTSCYHASRSALTGVLLCRRARRSPAALLAARGTTSQPEGAEIRTGINRWIFRPNPSGPASRAAFRHATLSLTLFLGDPVGEVIARAFIDPPGNILEESISEGKQRAHTLVAEAV